MNKTPLLALPLLLASLPSFALDWHVGVGAAAELDGRGPTVAGVEPEAGTAWTLLAGARHRSGFGVELAWLDLGRLEVPGIADAGYRVDGSLFSAGVTYAPDTGPLQPYAKLGWFSRSEDGTALTIAGPRPFELDDDGVMAEVGGRWQFDAAWALRLGYAWYDFDDGADGSVQAVAELRF